MSDRPLRVLHLGNIANNAYNNAKLLRAAGVDCDVLCPFYYHSMACPEWEDADFDEAVDAFRPAWHAVDLHGFERPAWFSQGPPFLAVRYLIARRRGQRMRAGLYRRLLAWNGRIRSGPLGTLGDTVRSLLRSGPGPLRQLSRLPPRKLVRHGFVTIARAGIQLALGFALWLLALRSLFRGRLQRDAAGAADAAIDQAQLDLVHEFRRRFPDRIDALQVSDLQEHAGDATFYAELFAHYDVVQAYSTDPIYPLLAGYRPYVAFEHGTLREIPWEATSRGRCTSLAYALADHVLVTNPDCRGTAELLNPGQVTVMNHPWDEDHALGVSGVEVLREELLRDLDAEQLVFFPTRHDWVAGTGYADKANDRFFRALARWMRDTGRRVGVICCEWGQNVEESRTLVAELGLTAHVRWSLPMGTVRFERFVLASDLVADQFEVPGMGGIAFKALSAGRPVLMRIEEDVMRAKYGEPPPVFNCHGEDDIYAALGYLLEPSEARQRRCDETRNWIKKHHAGREVVEKQLVVYARLTDARPAKEALR